MPLTTELVSLVLYFPFQFAESHAKVKIERNYLNKEGYFAISQDLLFLRFDLKGKYSIK